MSHVRKVNPQEWDSLRRSASRLTSLDIELTERCNNDCIHCSINLPADDSRAAARELSTGEVKAILGEAASLGCLLVRFTGGEPLLRPDFEDLYLTARRQGMRVLLFSNATLLTPRLADTIAETPPGEAIEVTVYGMSRSSYEAVTRSPGSFEAAQSGLRLLVERKVPFVVKYALLPPNRHEMDDFEDWASTIPWMDKPPVYSAFLNLRHRRDSEQKNETIRHLRMDPVKGVELFAARGGDALLRSMEAFCRQFMFSPGPRLFSCGAGIRGGCVDAYGRFQMCLSLRHPATVYDLTAGSLRDALESFFPRIRALEAENPEYFARCGRCFLGGLCEQCPAKSWVEHGTLDTPVDYHCAIAHARARWLGLVAPGEHAWDVKNVSERLARLSDEPPPPTETMSVPRCDTGLKECSSIPAKPEGC